MRRHTLVLAKCFCIVLYDTPTCAAISRMLTPLVLILEAFRFCAAVSPDRRTGTSCFLSRSRIVVLEVLKARPRAWLDSPDW